MNSSTGFSVDIDRYSKMLKRKGDVYEIKEETYNKRGLEASHQNITE